MAAGRVTAGGWWAALLSLVCLFPGSLTSDGGKGEGEVHSTVPGTSSVPGLSVVYTVGRYYPGHTPIACVKEDLHDALVTSLVPPHLPNPTFRRSRWMNEIQWHLDVKALKEEAARGGTCSTAAAPLYPVSFPLMSSRARLLPEHLSYTISAGEDFRVRLRGATPRGEVWWQKEPLQQGGWKQTTLTDDGALLIPATMLAGSGFYSFVNESDVNDTSILGTVSLLVRDCPAHRYGDACRGWCPDCLHGGACHPRTGECVCPEGIAGRRCEVRCAVGTSGRECTVLSLNIPGRQVCPPSPVPCRCTPGYTGPRCKTACTAGKWGGDCAQDCHLHCKGDCNTQNGECDAQGPTLCSGGDAGLPRLRRAPEVTDIWAEQATVEFKEWEEGYDDGDAAPWDTLTYIVRLKTSNSSDSLDKDVISSGPRQTLTNLKPATMYEVQVLVRVAASGGTSNLTCMAEGMGRERIHSTLFATTCPEEIPAPVIIRTEKTSDTSVFVKWKPVPRPKGCHVQYHLSAIPEATGGASGALETWNITLKETHAKVEGLEANVAYTISVLAKGTSSSTTSAASSTVLRIHKKSVGGMEIAVTVTAILIVTASVIAGIVWRRRRRRHSSIAISAEERPPSPSPSSPLSPDESACEVESARQGSPL